jgi:hypothetical protein
MRTSWRADSPPTPHPGPVTRAVLPGWHWL